MWSYAGSSSPTTVLGGGHRLGRVGQPDGGVRGNGYSSLQDNARQLFDPPAPHCYPDLQNLGSTVLAQFGGVVVVPISDTHGDGTTTGEHEQHENTTSTRNLAEQNCDQNGGSGYDLIEEQTRAKHMAGEGIWTNCKKENYMNFQQPFTS